MKTVGQIRRLTDPYGDLEHTDCVGLSHVLHYVLEAQGIAHTLYMGCDFDTPAIYHRVNKIGFTHHMWLELNTKEGKAVIDYRARDWVGSLGNTPHGVFLKRAYPHIEYHGHKIEPIYPDWTVMWIAHPDRYAKPDDAALQQIEAQAARGPMRDWEERNGGRYFPSHFHSKVVRSLSR